MQQRAVWADTSADLDLQKSYCTGQNWSGILHIADFQASLATKRPTVHPTANSRMLPVFLDNAQS